MSGEEEGGNSIQRQARKIVVMHETHHFYFKRLHELDGTELRNQAATF